MAIIGGEIVAELAEVIADAAIETDVVVAADGIAETAAGASAATATSESAAGDLVDFVTAYGGSTECAGESATSDLAEAVIDNYYEGLVQNETLVDGSEESLFDATMSRVQGWVDAIPDEGGFEFDEETEFDLEETELKEIRTSTPSAERMEVRTGRARLIRDLQFHRDFFENDSICNRVLRAYGRVRRYRFVMEDMPSGIQKIESYVAPGPQHSGSSYSATSSSIIGRNTAFASQLPIEEPGMASFIEQVATYVPRRAAINVMRVLSYDPYIEYNPNIVEVVRQLGLNIVSQPKFSMYLFWLVYAVGTLFGIGSYLLLRNIRHYQQLVNKYVPDIEKSVFSKYNKPWVENDIYKLVYEVDIQVMKSMYKKKTGVNNQIKTLLSNLHQNQYYKLENACNQSGLSYLLQQLDKPIPIPHQQNILLQMVKP